ASTSRSMYLVSRLYLHGRADHRDLPSFPTRRSSDLPAIEFQVAESAVPRPRRLRTTVPSGTARLRLPLRVAAMITVDAVPVTPEDRKSTRLNSSHVKISYAVFCLKKKTT